MIAKLALEDGCVFTGTAFGATGTRTGEVVFNTALTGYQEVFTDPSYCGQIVAMTFPLIGNTGVNPADFEATRPHLSALVVKELPSRPSNYRATGALPDALAELGVIGLAGIDTRALTRRIRERGALRGAISTERLDDIELVKLAADSPTMAGANLVPQVTPCEFGCWSEPLWSPTPGLARGDRLQTGPTANVAAGPGPLTPPGRCQGRTGRTPPHGTCHVVVIDCGSKHNILRHLVACGCTVTVAPADADPSKVHALKPDAIVVSNGPGDPAAATGTVALLTGLLGRCPILGICLGHQMLALALGAETYKLRFGHHGANVPVLNVPADRVEITSQNHGFAVSSESLRKVGGVPTHLNLNDDSLEGFIHPDRQVLALQFHPEASPGPHDAQAVFRCFVEAVRLKRPLDFDWLGRLRGGAPPRLRSTSVEPFSQRAV